MTAAKMLTQMRKMLGWGEPNPIHAWYGGRNGAEFRPGSVPWCQMTVTWAAFYSDNYEAVCPRGDRAYTVYGAEDGRDLGRWYEGTADNIRRFAQPGAIVYFDWDGTNTPSRVDHVGVVERNLGDGRVQTLEGNSDDRGKRRVRGPSVIAGFWNPPYAGGAATPARPQPATKKNWTEALVDTLPLLKVGAKGTAVKRAFYLLESHDFGLDPDVYNDTTFTPAMGSKVAAFQQAKKLKVDKQIGPATWAALVKP